MKKEQILTEISEYQSIIDTPGVPADEKAFAEIELNKLKAKLDKMEVPVAEQKEPDTNSALKSGEEKPVEKKRRGRAVGSGKKNEEKAMQKKRAKGEKIARKLAKKYAKITSRKKINKIYHKNESNNANTDNAILLATMYGTQKDIDRLVELFGIQYAEGDTSSTIKERDEYLISLWDKHVKKMEEEKKSLPSSIDVERIQADLHELQQLLPHLKEDDEILRANEDIEALELKLKEAQTATSEPVVKEKKKRGRKVGWRKPVSAPPKVTPVEQPAKKKRGRKVGYRKPKTVEMEKGTYDALRVNKLLVNLVGRVWHKNKIQYGIGDEKKNPKKYVMYIVPKNAHRAYELYKELAKEYDIKVNKAETMTKF